MHQTSTQSLPPATGSGQFSQQSTYSEPQFESQQASSSLPKTNATPSAFEGRMLFSALKKYPYIRKSLPSINSTRAHLYSLTFL